MFAVATTLCLVLSNFTDSVHAVNPTSTPTSVNVQIPANIKSISELGDYLYQKGIVTNFEEFKTFMENNKATIRRINPKTIDYGFTMNFYTEINTPSVNNGVQSSVFNQNGYMEWIVPVVITNTSKQPQEISKESFSLVPHLLEPGHEKTVLALKAEYIKDSTTGNVIGNVKVSPGTEMYINVFFHIFTSTTMDNVKIRLYDGKDHTDIKISNP